MDNRSSDIFNPNESEHYILAKTPKGLLTYSIYVIIDDISNELSYVLYFLGEEVFIDTNEDKVEGDIDGDEYVTSFKWIN